MNSRDQAIESASADSVSSLVRSLGVRRIWQRMPGIVHPNSACGPVSGAMVAGYLHAQGYPIDFGDQDEDIISLINRFWEQMSRHWGASMERYRTTLQQHLNKNYPSPVWRIVASGAVDFNTYKQSIDEGFPVAIRFNNLLGKQGVYSRWHFVVGEAYLIKNGVQYIGVKDPDRGENQTETLYFPWEANAPYMSLALLKYDGKTENRWSDPPL